MVEVVGLLHGCEAVTVLATVPLAHGLCTVQIRLGDRLTAN